MDIEAQLPDSRRRLFIEAKGDRPGGREAAKRRVALGEALLQILTAYDGQAVCGTALPFSEGYVNLVRNIFPGIQRLGLHVVFVRDAEVWHLSPKAKGFFPTRPESLVGVLEK